MQYFKINAAPFLGCPLFFKEYFNLQVKINKMLNIQFSITNQVLQD